MIIEPLPNKRIEFFRSPFVPFVSWKYNLLIKRASELRKKRVQVVHDFFLIEPEALVKEHPLIDPWLRTKICIPGPSSILVRFLRHYLYLLATHARSARVHVHTHGYNILARMNGAAGRRSTSLVSELGDLTTTCLIFPRAPERTSRIPMR